MMFGNLWNAVVRPSLTRRLVLAQIGLLLILWLGMVFLIIKDIAYTDRWYTPGIEPISRSILEPCTTNSG